MTPVSFAHFEEFSFNAALGHSGDDAERLHALGLARKFRVSAYSLQLAEVCGHFQIECQTLF